MHPEQVHAMGPTQAVFNTAELLESIILELPTFAITKVMRVAKSWKKIITTSSRIRDRRKLQPYSYPTPADMPIPNPSVPDAMPRYNCNPQLRPNYPVFGKMDVLRVFGTSYWVNIHPCGMPPGGKFDDHYISVPPCQAVAIYINCHTYNQCTVYRKDGVKIRDLREAADAFWASQDMGAIEGCGIFATFDVAEDQSGKPDVLWAIEEGWMACTVFRYEADHDTAMKMFGPMLARMNIG